MKVWPSRLPIICIWYLFVPQAFGPETFAPSSERTGMVIPSSLTFRLSSERGSVVMLTIGPIPRAWNFGRSFWIACSCVQQGSQVSPSWKYRRTCALPRYEASSKVPPRVEGSLSGGAARLGPGDPTAYGCALLLRDGFSYLAR